MSYEGNPTYSREDVAGLLSVSPARVSQIARQLKLRAFWNGSQFTYSKKQLRLMRERNTKPGPRPTTKRKAGR